MKASCNSVWGWGWDWDGCWRVRVGEAVLCSSLREESAAEEGVLEVVGTCEDGLLGGIRSQTIHHPRLVLQVRSNSCGRERVST